MPCPPASADAEIVQFLDVTTPPQATRRAPVVLRDRGAGWELRFPLALAEMLCWEDLPNGHGAARRIPILVCAQDRQWAVALPYAVDLARALGRADALQFVGALATAPDSLTRVVEPLTAHTGV